MKPNGVEDSVFLPETGVKAIEDEVANGEYGLVISGHSLVRHAKFPVYNTLTCLAYYVWRGKVCLFDLIFFFFLNQEKGI